MKKFAAALMLVCLSLSLSGCVIVPYDDHPRHGYWR
jgi:hypothetical protein